jgi:hypothetical protein
MDANREKISPKALPRLSFQVMRSKNFSLDDAISLKLWGSIRPAIAGQRLANEAAISEAGGVGYLRTVGRPEDNPSLVVRLTDARAWWQPLPTVWETLGH